MTENASSPEQLRASISRGGGKDKVSFPDPSSAPLGTDEEAAGTPVSNEAAELAANHEVRREPQPVVEGAEPTAGAGPAAGIISVLAAATGLGIIALLAMTIWMMI